MLITNNKTRVFHLENNKVIRKMIHGMLQDDDRIILLGGMEYSNFHTRLLVCKDVDVLVIGLNRPAIEPAENQEESLCYTIRVSIPDIKIVAHSAYNDTESIKKIMNSGAHGFVSKLGKKWEISEAIQAVSAGERYICGQTSLALKNSGDYFNGHSNCLLKNERIFTRREMDVLGLLGIGLSSKEIAANLYISLKTVETHRKSLIRKSYVRNTAQLIAFSSLHGYL